MVRSSTVPLRNDFPNQMGPQNLYVNDGPMPSSNFSSFTRRRKAPSKNSPIERKQEYFLTRSDTLEANATDKLQLSATLHLRSSENEIQQNGDATKLGVMVENPKATMLVFRGSVWLILILLIALLLAISLAIHNTLSLSDITSANRPLFFFRQSNLNVVMFDSLSTEKEKDKMYAYTYTDPISGTIKSGLSPKQPGQSSLKRMVFYSTPNMEAFSSHSVSESTKDKFGEENHSEQPAKFLDTMLHVRPGEETNKTNDRLRAPYIIGDCVPMQEWQTWSFPTCNLVHELDMSLAGQIRIFNVSHGSAVMYKSTMLAREEVLLDENTKLDTNEYLDDEFSILGRGWFRHTWKVISGTIDESFVLKTLRLERDFYDEYYDLHRRDAIAMERLTSSPYVLNVYGYCGQSAINEYANFIDNFHDFKNFARQLRDNNEGKVLKLKLQIVAMIALGITHIHEIDGPNNATLVHYDINPMNVAVTKGGIPKLNDFNVAEFLRWDVKKNERCGFHGRLHEPWWRAPEEMIIAQPIFDKNGRIIDPGPRVPLLDEKVDVYSLGNIIYNLLTGHAPRGRTIKDRANNQRKLVKNGTAPTLETFYEESKEPAIVAMKEAMVKCFKPKPEDRSSAREVAQGLLNALAELK